MNPAASPLYKFPVDQAVYIFHPTCDIKTGRTLIAVVAPTFTSGVSHFGIVDADAIGSEWRFVNGPSVVRTSKVWRKLFEMDEVWEYSTSNFLDKTHNCSIPTRSLDDFADLVVGEVKL